MSLALLSRSPAAPSATVSVVSSVTVLVSSPSTGGSLTAVTVMTWLAVAVPPWPSLMTYGKLTVPLKLAAGVKVITPAALTLTVPLVTGIVCATPGVSVVPLMLVTVSGLPSGSLSPVSGASVIGVPSSAMV